MKIQALRWGLHAWGWECVPCPVFASNYALAFTLQLRKITVKPQSGQPKSAWQVTAEHDSFGRLGHRLAVASAGLLVPVALGWRFGPLLSGSKPIYTKIGCNTLPHHVPLSSYSTAHKNTGLTKPFCSQYYGKTKQTCRNVCVWSSGESNWWPVSRTRAPWYYRFDSTAVSTPFLYWTVQCKGTRQSCKHN